MKPLPAFLSAFSLALAAFGANAQSAGQDIKQGAKAVGHGVATGAREVVASLRGINGAPSFSPDGRRLYVNESAQRNVWVYDIDAAGDLSNKRLLIAFADHGLDGMRSDVDGNLYIARYGAGLVAVVSPQGELLREVPLRGAKPTNVAFGGADGRDVYVTLQDRGAIEVFRSDRPGREYGR